MLTPTQIVTLRFNLFSLITTFFVVSLIFTCSVKADQFYIPKTGQIKCYNTAGEEITNCIGTGQDGEKQTGAAWPEPRFHSSCGQKTRGLRLWGIVQAEK